MSKPLVLVTEPIAPGPQAWLAERAEVVEAPPDSGVFADLLPRAAAMVVRTYTLVNKALLDVGTNLRVIGRAGVALDNFDLDVCRERGVAVVHAPGANSSAVAEYVFAILFDALRPRRVLTEAVGLPEWSRIRAELIAERQLEGLTLGVYGLGRIGKRVARIGGAFGMRVLYNDLLEIPEGERWGAEPASVDRLLAESDVFTVHVDDRPANRDLMDAGKFARMKPDAVFLSCARGLIVDPHAMAEYLRANPRAMALCDVHEPEPFGADHPALGLANARLYPHIAAATEIAKENMSWVVRDVWRALSGETPEHRAV